MSISNFSCFNEKWRLKNTLIRLHKYIEAWSENTLLVPTCYLIKTAWSNGTLIYTCTLIWVCLHCLLIRVECTNSGDWSADTFVTCDHWNSSQIILKKNPTKKLLIQSICTMWTHPWHFYGDLVYKLKKIVDSNNFSAQFIKIISHYKKIGYNINVLQQTACLVVNPITVGNFAFLFNCTPVGRTSDSMMVPT